MSSARNHEPAGKQTLQGLNSELLALEGGTSVRLLLAPVGKLNPDKLLATLPVRDRERATSLRNPARYAEYVISRWMIQQLSRPESDSGSVSISHCRRWIAVAGSDQGDLGLDVESRLPRQLPAVIDRLGWGALAPEQYQQAWTLWEAWRKLAGGSVLDEPDDIYAGTLVFADSLFEAPRSFNGITWWSKQLKGGCLSLAWRS